MEKTEKTLKIIKPFITALKKQGLEMARLACLGREYRYSPEKGLRQTGMEPVEIDFPEPVKPEKAAGRYPKEKKMPSYRLTLVLLFVAMVLFIGIIFLNQRLSRKDMEPVEVVNPSAGESASGILIPEKENEMAGDEMNQDRPASDGQRPTGEDSNSRPYALSGSGFHQEPFPGTDRVLSHRHEHPENRSPPQDKCLRHLQYRSLHR
jgi:hypothetical protein